MAVRDEFVREEIMRVGGRSLRVAVRPGTGTGPPLLLCNGIGMRLEAFRPFVDALDPAIEVIRFDAPGVGGSQLPNLPYRLLPWPCSCARCCIIRPRAGRRPGCLLGRRAGSAVRAAQPAPVPAADPGGDRNRAADDGAAQPAAAGEEPPPAPLGRPVGRKRENRPGRADQRPAQGADQPAQHRFPVPAHRRAGVHHAAAAAAHPAAHPGAHRRPGPDHPGGQRPLLAAGIHHGRRTSTTAATSRWRPARACSRP